MKRRRKRGPEEATAGNTRLVYSTGGQVPEPEPSETTLARKGPGIRLRLERRASGRVVTVVSGLPGRPTEVAALARELKTACGAGGTVKDGVLEIQGDQRDHIEAALARWGLGYKRAGG